MFQTLSTADPAYLFSKKNEIFHEERDDVDVPFGNIAGTRRKSRRNRRGAKIKRFRLLEYLDSGLKLVASPSAVA